MNSTLTSTTSLFLISKVFNYFSLSVLVLGVPGNLLMLAVFSRKTLIKLSFSVYFRVLSLTNLYVCISWLLIFLQYEFNIDLDSLSWFLCRLGNYITYIISAMSAWLFVASMIDRLIAIARPSKLMLTQKPRVAWIIVAFLFIYNSSFYVFIVFTTSYVASSENLSNSSINFTNQIVYSCLWSNRISYSLFDLINSVVLPFAIMLVSTVAVCLAVYKSRKRVERFENVSQTTVRTNAGGSLSDWIRSQTKSMRMRDVKFGLTLGVYNLIFIFLNAPDCLMNTLSQYFTFEIDPYLWNFIYEISVFLLNFLCSITFYLQIAVNCLVRKECWQIFRSFKTRVFKS